MSYKVNPYTNLPDYYQASPDLSGYVPYQSDGGFVAQSGWGGFKRDSTYGGPGALNEIFLNADESSGQADVILNNSDGSQAFSFGYYEFANQFFLSDNVAVQFWTVDRYYGTHSFGSGSAYFSNQNIRLGDSSDGSASFASGNASIAANGLTTTPAFILEPSQIGGLTGGFMPDYGGAPICNFGINMEQFYVGEYLSWDNTQIGGMFRLDGRYPDYGDYPFFQVLFQPIGASSGFGDQQGPLVITSVDIGIMPSVLIGWPGGGTNNDGTYNGENLQVYNNAYIGGNLQVSTINGVAPGNTAPYHYGNGNTLADYGTIYFPTGQIMSSGGELNFYTTFGQDGTTYIDSNGYLHAVLGISDTLSSRGTEGQVLTSTAAQVKWKYAPQIISQTSINAKTVANTSLYTVPSGRTLQVTGVVVRCSAAASITVPATAGIGTSAGTSNLATAAALTSLTATTASYIYTMLNASLISAAASQVYFNLTVGATGTSQTIVVDLIGYLL